MGSLREMAYPAEVDLQKSTQQRRTHHMKENSPVADESPAEFDIVFRQVCPKDKRPSSTSSSKPLSFREWYLSSKPLSTK